jgi:hypothetical protein
MYLKKKGKAVPLHAMEALGGRGCIAPFTTSALDGGEWSASRPCRAFTPGERTPGTHCTGGWLGPRANLDTEDRGKILCPYNFVMALVLVACYQFYLISDYGCNFCFVLFIYFCCLVSYPVLYLSGHSAVDAAQ